MDIFVSLIWVGSGISLFASLQFVVFGMMRRQEQVFLAFGVLCFLLGVYMMLSAQWYHTVSVTNIAVLSQLEMGIICLVYPVFVWFLSLYTGHITSKKVMIPVCLLFGGLFIVNIFSANSFLYSSSAEDAPIYLPWGEVVSHFELQTGPFAWPYYAATYAVFFWSLLRCVNLWKNNLKLRALSITAYLFLQILIIVHAELVDNLNWRTVYFGEFPFLFLVILVSITLARELKNRSLVLEKTVRELRDETARREGYERELNYMAFHDHLTDLPNRRSLSKQLENALQVCSQNRTFGAMLLIDLDHFKMINDSLGHSLGDQLLQMVSQRLQHLLPSSNRPIRLGGDEFAVFFTGRARIKQQVQENAIALANSIFLDITRPYRIVEHELAVGASIGIALFDADTSGLQDIMRQADMALYSAKSSGRNSIEVFAPNLERRADERLIIDKGIRRAIENGDIELHFQPQVDVQGTIVGTEVLARWQHPQLGYIPPTRFIAVAEESGLIHLLGENVLQQACRYLRTWQDQKLHMPPHLSINASPWQLDSSAFTKMVITCLYNSGVDPAKLNIEITESTFMRDIRSVSKKINELSELGVTFSIDDFGTGYSALAWLKKLSLQELKIDKMFVHDMSLNHVDKLIETILAIARHMGLQVIVEGVETAAQRAALESMGCRNFQGYLISPPLPETAYRQWMQEVEHAHLHRLH